MGAAGSVQRGAHCSAMGVGLSVWFCRNSSAVSVAGDSFRHQENVHPTGMWWLTWSGLPTSRGDLEVRAPHGTGELPPWSLSPAPWAHSSLPRSSTDNAVPQRLIKAESGTSFGASSTKLAQEQPHRPSGTTMHQGPPV